MREHRSGRLASQDPRDQDGPAEISLALGRRIFVPRNASAGAKSSFIATTPEFLKYMHAAVELVKTVAPFTLPAIVHSSRLSKIRFGRPGWSSLTNSPLATSARISAACRNFSPQRERRSV